MKIFNVFILNIIISFCVTGQVIDNNQIANSFNEDSLRAILNNNGTHANEIEGIIRYEKSKYIGTKLGTWNKVYQINPTLENSGGTQPCTNVDFETGDFTGWEGTIGCNTSHSSCRTNCCDSPCTVPIGCTISGFGNTRHVIMSDGLDPIGNFPRVLPGGTYSLRLGNIIAGAEAESIMQTFLVTEENSTYTYYYAVVLEDPGHIQSQQPRFRVEMLDQNNQIIPCSEFDVSAGQGIEGFTTIDINFSRYVYKPWSPNVVDLSNYIGQTVTIEFSTFDCGLGAHAGYAYIDGSCFQDAIEVLNEPCSNIILPFYNAAVGTYIDETYLWDFGDGNTSTEALPTHVYNTGGTYTVSLTISYSGSTGCNSRYFEEDINIEDECPCKNSVINADFELGNVGFGTGTIPNVCSCQSQSYCVVKNSHEHCNNFDSIEERTNPGVGNFLMMDGYTNDSGDVWVQDINIKQNTTYEFSLWTRGHRFGNEPPCPCELRINNEDIDAIISKYDISGWVQRRGIWNSESTEGTVPISLYINNSVGIGCDFGIDDIVFKEVCGGYTTQCDDCGENFAPEVGKPYLLSAWAREINPSQYLTHYTSPQVELIYTNDGAANGSATFSPSGDIIEFWQRIEGEFTVPLNTTDIEVKLKNLSGVSSGIDVYFDDIRMHPVDANMKSFVYDPLTNRLMAELDENNYATFYEYDLEGALVRVKKETERGIMTIQESRNHTYMGDESTLQRLQSPESTSQTNVNTPKTTLKTTPTKAKSSPTEKTNANINQEDSISTSPPSSSLKQQKQKLEEQDLKEEDINESDLPEFSEDGIQDAIGEGKSKIKEEADKHTHKINSKKQQAEEKLNNAKNKQDELNNKLKQKSNSKAGKWIRKILNVE